MKLDTFGVREGVVLEGGTERGGDCVLEIATVNEQHQHLQMPPMHHSKLQPQQTVTI